METRALLTAPPLSVAQEALWYRARLAPTEIAYNEAISIRKDGPLDADALRQAWHELVSRHEAWRTTFDTLDGAPVQVVHPSASFDLPVLDLSGLTREQAERRATALVAGVAAVPYDVSRGPLLRPRLVRFSSEHHRLYLAMHHLVFDGVSMTRVVLPELVALYDACLAGLPSPLPEPRAQYADYARWERQWIDDPRAERRLSHWRRRLAEAPGLSLPVDRPRPVAQRFRGGTVELSMSGDDRQRLLEVGQRAGATLFQVLGAVWALLLSRWSGQEDVVFGAAADMRQRPEFEGVVGYCLTPLVLRVDLSGDPSFVELVVRIRNELLDGLDRLLPFERLVRDLQHEAFANANPIYQTMLVMEPASLATDPTWSLHQIDAPLADAVGNAKLDLELQLDERPEGHIVGQLVYDCDLFERETVARMADHWLRLVGAAAADPDAPALTLSMLSPDEQQRQLVEWNATATDRPLHSVAELIRGCSRREPHSVAVSDGELTITYEELVQRAETAAGRLLASGVTPADVAAPGEAWSAERVVDALGELAARAGRQPRGAGPDAAANLAIALVDALGIGPSDAILTLPGTAARAPAVALWLGLITGARLVLAPADVAADGAALSALIADEGVTLLHAPASAWQTLIDTGLRAKRGLNALSGGERLSPELADAILERCRVLWNAYGTEQTSGYCTLARVGRPGPVTIGRPLANTRAYVLDGRDQPVPIGVTGELLIAGDGVDDAYLRRGTGTLVAEPLGPGRALRTGDRARWLSDGQLELVHESIG